MNHHAEKDGRAFNPHAGAVEALIDEDVPVATQHAPDRRGAPLCGAPAGFVRTGIVTEYGITCAACLARFKARKPRRRRGK